MTEENSVPCECVSKKSHLIYWALADYKHWALNFNHDSEDYEEIKRARDWISDKYHEHKSNGLSYPEAAYIASIDWLHKEVK